jgi:hypothetical protein
VDVSVCAASLLESTSISSVCARIRLLLLFVTSVSVPLPLLAVRLFVCALVFVVGNHIVTGNVSTLTTEDNTDPAALLIVFGFVPMLFVRVLVSVRGWDCVFVSVCVCQFVQLTSSPRDK